MCLRIMDRAWGACERGGLAVRGAFSKRATVRSHDCVVRESCSRLPRFVFSRVRGEICSNDPRVIHFPNHFNVFRVGARAHRATGFGASERGACERDLEVLCPAISCWIAGGGAEAGAPYLGVTRWESLFLLHRIAWIISRAI